MENFKCFSKPGKHLYLSQVNLLTGVNGRGKSSLLQALLLLSQSFDSENSLTHLKLNGPLLSLGTFKDVFRRNAVGKDGFRINIETDDLRENKICCRFSEYEGKERLARLSELWVDDHDYFDTPSEADAGKSSNVNSILGVTSSIAGFQELRRLYYIAANRQGPVNYVEKNDNIGPDDIGTRGEHVINVLSTRGDEIINKTEKVLSDILSGASVRVPKSEGSIIELFIDSINNSDGFTPVNVGFGYSYILPIILIGLLAEDNSIIIIENPEAHLHPGAQSRLVNFLVECAVQKHLQIFVETHSDHIINGLRIAVKNKKIAKTETNIIHFGRGCEDDLFQIDQIKIDSEGNLSKYPDDFMDEWTRQMAQLI